MSAPKPPNMTEDEYQFRCSLAALRYEVSQDIADDIAKRANAALRAATAAAHEADAQIAEAIADELQTKAGNASDEDDVDGYDIATTYVDRVADAIRERAKPEKVTP